MGRPDYADVQWLHWLCETGILGELQEGRLPEFWPSVGQTTSFYARFIMDQCIHAPAAYWPQIVHEECRKLLVAGVDADTIKSVLGWLDRELALPP